MTNKKISLSKPLIEEADIISVTEVLKSGWLTQGPKVAKFEHNFAEYLGSKYAVAVNSATSGLHLSLLAVGVGCGDEVIVPAYSWVSTANVVELCGATTVFVDIDLSSFNANINAILEKITSRTKAIIPVHLFGKPFDVRKLQTRLSLPIAIIEDAACAAGGKIKGEFCGAIGDIGVFSFHPRKSVTTGEGGMVVTDSRDIYRKLVMLRNHGQNTFEIENHPGFMADCPIVGYNYRMTDIQAALGISQLEKLDRLIHQRNELAAVYHSQLRSLETVSLPSQRNDEACAWQAYVIMITTDMDSPQRDDIMVRLKEHGVETRPGTHAIPLLSFYKAKYSIKPNDFPNTVEAFQRSIALPLHNHMIENDCKHVCECLRKTLNA